MKSLLALILIASISEVFSEKKVLVLSFDGFRSDYYHKDKTPKLWVLRSRTAAPKYMESIFPSKTMVTLHSLSTGVYPDTHGVYANEMFDDRGGVKQYKDNHYDDLNKEIVPIWIENQNNGGKSGLMMWPGGEFKYGSAIIPLHQVYNEALYWQERALKIVNWINDDKCNLVMANFEDYPFYSREYLNSGIQSHISEVDNIIEAIIKAIPFEYNVLILSDHGTSEVPGTNVIDIDSVVTESTFQKIVSGPLVFVKVPISTMRSTMYTTLKQKAEESKHFNVYDKDHFKHNWYIKDLATLADVLVIVAEPQYSFMEPGKFQQQLKNLSLTRQTIVTLENGYDNNEADIRALFVGIGPGFKDKEFSDDFIKLIDVYPCLKALLLLKGNASSVQTQNALSTVMKQLLVPDVVTAYES